MRLTPIALLVPLLLGASECAPRDADKRPTIKFTNTQDLILPDDNRAWTYDVPQDRIEQICTGTDKLVCEWFQGHPNATRAFESAPMSPWGARSRTLDVDPTETELTVRCGQGDTYAGICEDWFDVVGNPRWAIDAVSMYDIGTCSASIPTEFFLDSLVAEFQKQSDARLGEQRPPEAEDIVLWLDFVLGLKDSSAPTQAWVDWTRGPVPGLGAYDTRSEIIVQLPYRVDGDISFAWDPDWLDGSVGGALVQGTLWVLAWPSIFFGDCERDRDMMVNLRGWFEATEDGGVGIKINEFDACGPDHDRPCTWVRIQDWPARPICNNRVKPRIESSFKSMLVQSMVDPATGKPRNLTRQSDGASRLPWRFPDGSEVKVERVEMTPTQMHFIFIDDLATSPYRDRYNELYAMRLCNDDRHIAPDIKKYVKGGFFQ